MHTRKSRQEGFSIILLIIGFLVATSISFAGYFVWSAQNRQETNTASKAQSKPVSPIAKIAAETPRQQLRHYDGWGTSNDFLSSGFSFRLPIFGWRMSSITGEDGTSRTWIVEDSGYGLSTEGAQFSIEIDISNTAESASSYNGAISSGMGSTLGSLSNGIKIWQSNKATFDHADILYCGGGRFNRVVQLSAQSGDKLYVPLPNGKYMTYKARFCQYTTGQNLNASYEQQANSEEMIIASRILASIQYQDRWTPPQAD